jgi:[acyl-carrier-protein] S-malonyltransferase
MAQSMETVTWSEPEVPLAANATGELVTTADAVREALIAQIASPVRWVDCVETLVENGATTFIELGPGRVLSGLVRRIAPDATTANADSPAKLAELAEAQAAASGGSQL